MSPKKSCNMDNQKNNHVHTLPEKKNSHPMKRLKYKVIIKVHAYYQIPDHSWNGPPSTRGYTPNRKKNQSAIVFWRAFIH